MYRYSRGQPGPGGVGSLPRPAWGSSGGRTASPEPGGLTGSNAGTPLGGGAEQAKEEGPTQVILQLEAELLELRNACSWKDQRIAELSRTDMPAARLKRDIRHLAAELHLTRKELSESVRELQELRSQMERGETGSSSAPRDIVESSSAVAGGKAGQGANSVGRSAGGDRGLQQRARIAELEEENRSLRETAAQVKAQGLPDTLHQSHARQPSGASTQRIPEPTTPPCVSPMASATFAATPAGGRQSYVNQQVAALQAPTSATMAASAPSTSQVVPANAPQELGPILYSSQLENGATIGPTMLQGVGTVDGVAMVAKVLLQRIQSSVCSAHRRGQPLAQA